MKLLKAYVVLSGLSAVALPACSEESAPSGATATGGGQVTGTGTVTGSDSSTQGTSGAVLDSSGGMQSTTSATSAAQAAGTTGATAVGGATGAGGATSSGSGGGGEGGEPDAGLYPNGSCSEDTLRTSAPPGKEVFNADPISNKFPFSSHWIGPWGADTEPKFMGQTAMADFDDDGDLDFAAGQRDALPGGMYWWERCTDDHWVTHKVGDGQQSDSSGDAVDVDRDGLIDIVTGDSWFKNPGNSRDVEWQRFDTGTPNAEDLTVGDVTGDNVPEIIYVNNGLQAQWFEIGATPQDGFEARGSLDRTIQQGTAWGDLNGDGANDWLISAHYWYENNGDGSDFTEHAIQATANFDANGSGNAPLTYVGDLDGDGDNDFATCSHWLGGQDTARLAWVENIDGQGNNWELHLLSDEGLYSHGVILADFDNDTDLDIFWARNVGPSFIWENSDGAGNFVEHRIVDDFRGHTPRIGDADCDGDLDIAGGPWGDRGPADHGESVGEPIRDYVYLRNHAVENGAPPIFDDARQPYELGWREKYHCR